MGYEILKPPQDLSTAWYNPHPLPLSSNNPRMLHRSPLVASLIDLWNAEYFIPRNTIIFLVKGRTICSGLLAGETCDTAGDPSDDCSSEDFDDTEYNRWSPQNYSYINCFGFYGANNSFSGPGVSNSNYLERSASTRLEWLAKRGGHQDTSQYQGQNAVYRIYAKGTGPSDE